MAETKTEICNAGLRKIGANPISDYDTDESPNAQYCRAIFPILFDATLRAFDWTCARARKQYLSTDATEPEFGYSFQYILPTDPWCLRPLRLLDHPEAPEEYRIEGRLLLTDYNTVDLLYTKRITDMTEVDALLSQVMVYLMAIELAPAIKDDAKLPKDLVEFVWKVWMPMARAASGKEGMVERLAQEKIHRLIKRNDYINGQRNQSYVSVG